MSITVNIVCYKWETLSNGEHPLMLCICKDRKRKYKSIGISLNPKFWDFEKKRLKAKFPNREYLNRIITDKTNSVNEEVIRLHSEKKEFTDSSIIDVEDTKPQQSTTVDDVFKQFLQHLSDERRRGYMLSVKQLYNSLIAFNSHLNIYFSEIDSIWLKKI